MPVSSIPTSGCLPSALTIRAKKDLAQARLKTSQSIGGQVVNEICVNLIKRAKFPEVKISALSETFYQK